MKVVVGKMQDPAGLFYTTRQCSCSEEDASCDASQAFKLKALHREVGASAKLVTARAASGGACCRGALQASSYSLKRS